MNKEYDVVGLGCVGVDYTTKVKTFSDKNNKIVSNNLSESEGGVTANNLVQASRLGLKTAWCGNIGNDELGKKILKNFKKENIKAFANKTGTTQQCWIIVDEKGEKEIYAFPNSSSELTPKIVDSKFKKIIERSNYFHTEASIIPLKAAIRGAEIAKKSGSKVLVDIDCDVDKLLNIAKIGTMKELEKLIILSDVVKMSESAGKSLYKNIKSVWNNKIIIMTKGSKGCVVINQGNKSTISAYKIKAVDTTGAGDAFMGGLSYTLLKGFNLKDAAKFANACGAYNCLKIGARQSGTLKQITNFMTQNKS
ncbi:MAG: carbohydrate kinase family protein [Nanoarchaeota archaeon]|nr:carbohydrate kinase family protein [Nanoarchaeota archaeon]